MTLAQIVYTIYAAVITWDESKRLANLAKHDLDFASLTPEFFASAIVLPGKGSRFRAIGKIAGAVFVAVVFQPLGSEALSIVSMRLASRKERSHAQANP